LAYQRGQRGWLEWTETTVGIPALDARPLPKVRSHDPILSSALTALRHVRRARGRYAAKIFGGKLDA
jgi:hypothetical protein